MSATYIGSQRAAVGTAALLRRHRKSPADIERLTSTDGNPVAVSAVTVRRILKGEAAREPRFDTLSRIAKCLGETIESVYGAPPAPESSPSPVISKTAMSEFEHKKLLRVLMRIAGALDRAFPYEKTRNAVDCEFCGSENAIVIDHDSEAVQEAACFSCGVVFDYKSRREIDPAP